MLDPDRTMRPNEWRARGSLPWSLEESMPKFLTERKPERFLGKILRAWFVCSCVIWH